MRKAAPVVKTTSTQMAGAQLKSGARGTESQCDKRKNWSFQVTMAPVRRATGPTLPPRAQYEHPWADPSGTGKKMGDVLTSSHSPLPSASLTPHPLGVSPDIPPPGSPPCPPQAGSLVPPQGSTAPSACPPSLAHSGSSLSGMGLSTPPVWGPQEAGQGPSWSPPPAQDGSRRKLSGCRMNE